MMKTRITSFGIACMALVALLCGCNNPQTYSVLEKECQTFENKFPTKTAEIDNAFTKDDKTWVIEYSSFEEAEWKMIHFFFPDGKPENVYNAVFDYNLFNQIVLSDSSSMSYPFDAIKQYAHISIVDSDDELVRIYTYEAPHDWTMSDYQEIIQYKWDGEVLVQGNKDCDSEDCPISEAQSIYTITKNEDTYYLVSYFFLEWKSLSYNSFNAFVLTEKGLKPIKLFKTEDGFVNQIGFECDALSWFDKTQGKDYDGLGYYDQESRTYYLPEEDYYINDRYHKYVFDGNYFVKKEESVANPFLSPMLQDYAKLEKLLETERNLIRIDQMSDGTYRYAAWKANSQMIDDPEIVILKGTYNETTHSYKFLNEGYEYQVSEEKVCVFKKGKMAASWGTIN